MPSLTTPTNDPTPEKKLSQAEKIIGYHFKNLTLGLEALQMEGDPSPLGAPVTYLGTLYRIPKNNRLAIVGDALLDAILADAWYATGRTPREWTRVQNEVVTNAALGAKGVELGIDKCILSSNGLAFPKMVATTVEALIGAVMRDASEEAGRDAGYAAVEMVVENLGLLEHESLRGRDEGAVWYV